MSDTDQSTPVSTESTAPVETTEATENQEEETLEEQQAEQEAKAQAEAAASSKKKFNVKVNNKAREVELDLANEKEVQKYIEKALGADDKFQEAAYMRKAVEELVKELKTNPRAVLMHEAIGINLKEFAQQILNEELAEMEKTPEQKKLEEMENKLRKYEEEKKKLEEEKEQERKAKLDEIAIQKLDDQITDALSNSDLPKSAYVLKRIADTMESAFSMGYTDVTVEQIIPFVEEQITGEISRLFDEAPEQTASKLMEKIVGKKNLDKYRKTKVAKAKQAVSTASAVKDTGTKAPEKKKEEPKSQKFKDAFGRW